MIRYDTIQDQTFSSTFRDAIRDTSPVDNVRRRGEFCGSLRREPTHGINPDSLSASHHAGRERMIKWNDCTMVTTAPTTHPRPHHRIIHCRREADPGFDVARGVPHLQLHDDDTIRRRRMTAFQSVVRIIASVLKLSMVKDHLKRSWRTSTIAQRTTNGMMRIG